MPHEQEQQNATKGGGQPMSAQPEYDVGYKKPPLHTRFRPGRSGNPRGRPKRSRELAAMIDDVLNAKVKVTENGRARWISKLELCVTQVANAGAAGDLKAASMLLKLKLVGKSAPRALSSAEQNNIEVSQESYETLRALYEVLSSSHPQAKKPAAEVL
jgi:hypothetical protein